MVFTGIVALTADGVFDYSTQRLTIDVDKGAHGNFWDDAAAGDSIAVNGVCLTLLQDVAAEDRAIFFLQKETLVCTTFGIDARGSGELKIHANLERAMQSGSTYGGHLVLGHVHGIGHVVSIDKNADGSADVVVRTPVPPPSLSSMFFRKGCITIDGVSLTIASMLGSADAPEVRVSLIPYTLQHTTLHLRRVGHSVNIEFAPPIPTDSGKSHYEGGSTEISSGADTTTWANGSTPSDADFMSRAIALGEKGRLTAPPNPWVACVIVARDGRTILGEGYHRQAGQPHAEVNAVRDALQRQRDIARGETPADAQADDAWIDTAIEGMRQRGASTSGSSVDIGNAEKSVEFLKGSTFYVTLEPCHHVGRTPPCDHLVIGSGAARVVVALVDPDARVACQGIKLMQEAGLKVDVGVGAAEAARSLSSYLHHRRTGLPLVVLKVAQSIDSKVACADRTSRWITGPAARRHSHLLRAQSQAIMVGVGTALADKPQLTVRDVPNGMHPINKQPLRVVVDTQGRMLDGPLVTAAAETPTLVFTSNLANAGTLSVWKRAGVEVEVVPVDPDGHVSLHAVLKKLGERGILQLLVDGGPTLQAALMVSVPEAIRRLYVYTGGMLLGASAIPWGARVLTRTIEDAHSFRWSPIDVQKLGDSDTVTVYEPNFGSSHAARKAVDPATGAPVPVPGPGDSPNVPTKFELSPVSEVIEAVAAGRLVLVMDDTSRENEGDLIMAARAVGERHTRLMIRHTSGIICAPMLKEDADRLNLPLMVSDNEDKHHTAFTVTCDANVVSTGVSATDRARTLRILGDPHTKPSDLSRPGHVFPLIAKPGLLAEREGHTEAGVALCKLANIDPPIAAIAELTNDDGTMSRRADVFHFARTHSIPVTTVAALKYHMGASALPDQELPVVTTAQSACARLQPASMLAECRLPVLRGGTDLGTWRMRCFNAAASPHASYAKGARPVSSVGGDGEDHVRVALIFGELQENMLVRVHSACFTGDVMGSGRCDCAEQLTLALRAIHDHGSGVVIYEKGQEGRGIGLVEKVHAYNLLENRPDLDTFQANTLLGHHEDLRSFDGAAEVLLALGIRSIRLLTSNPEKVQALEARGFIVEKTSGPVSVALTNTNRHYLQAKIARGHTIVTKLTASEAGSDVAPHRTHSTASTSIGMALSVDVLREVRVAVLRTCWNEQWVGPLTRACTETLENEGVLPQHIVVRSVPGAADLPLAAKVALTKVDAVICIGVLLKGETKHFDYISESVAKSIMDLKVSWGKPVVYGVLNLLTHEQAEERTSQRSQLGASWARSALSMIGTLRDLNSWS